MPNISNKKYKEYQTWLHNQEIQKVWESQKSVLNLEDDIDFPIKNLVAMFALAGCSPMWSCCGFDYKGQPLHKSHQYGEPYIIFEGTNASIHILGGIVSKLPQTWWVQNVRGRVHLERRFALHNPHWKGNLSPHFMEEIVSELVSMESILFPLLSPLMVDEVILEDTNKLASRKNKYWQYIPKNPWVITKEGFYI